MRIVIVAQDTRGGIQPYLALGMGLRGAGHDVVFVAPADFASSIADAGLTHAPLSGSVEEFVRGAGGAGQRGTLAAMRLAGRELKSRMVGWTREALDASEGADLMTGGIGGMVTGLAVADRLGIPFVETHLQPVHAPTSAYQGALFGSTPRWLGPLGRRLSHTLTEFGTTMPFASGMKAGRDALGVKGRSVARDGQPILYGFSRHVVPVPIDRDRRRHVTGWWFHDAPADWRPPAGMEEFLARPGPVVSIGFGSMTAEDPEATTRLVLDAIRSAGVRAVLLSGWGGLASMASADDIFIAPAIPHDRLFPRVRAIVHHGGAGTTGAALGAGVPSIVIPFSVDQPFWASRVFALGVGPAPIPRRRLSADRLARALTQALADEQMGNRARTLGDLIRSERGVDAAVAVFNELPAATD
jgi:UDP:flavonoid glycosyltransferase YjiC (YdhE family)